MPMFRYGGIKDLLLWCSHLPDPILSASISSSITWSLHILILQKIENTSKCAASMASKCQNQQRWHWRNKKQTWLNTFSAAILRGLAAILGRKECGRSTAVWFFLFSHSTNLLRIETKCQSTTTLAQDTQFNFFIERYTFRSTCY